MNRLLSIVLVLAFFCSHCGDSATKNGDDPIIAEVYARKLYASDMAQLKLSSSSGADSLAMANAYVEQWIRDNLMLIEAEKKRPSDLNIQKLVNDYRSSLLRFHYEKKIIEEKLDTVISSDEMNQFYDENKSQYLLSEPILKAQIAITDITEEDNGRMQQLWVQNEWKQIKSLCAQIDCAYFTEETNWISLSTFRDLVPAEVMSFESVKNKRKIKEEKEKYKFFLKINDFRDENEIPPLEFVQDQLTRVILHKRKQKILRDLTENLYETELKKNNVKVHVRS